MTRRVVEFGCLVFLVGFMAGFPLWFLQAALDRLAP